MYGAGETDRANQPVSWLYIRGVKAQLLMAAAVALVASACSGDKSQAAETPSATTAVTSVAPAYTWGQLRQDYTTLVLTCDLVMRDTNTDNERFGCLVQRSAAIKSARNVVPALPASKDRGDLITLFDGYLEALAKSDKNFCSASSTEVECTMTRRLMSNYDAAIGKVIADNANAGR